MPQSTLSPQSGTYDLGLGTHVHYSLYFLQYFNRKYGCWKGDFSSYTISLRIPAQLIIKIILCMLFPSFLFCFFFVCILPTHSFPFFIPLMASLSGQMKARECTVIKILGTFFFIYERERNIYCMYNCICLEVNRKLCLFQIEALLLLLWGGVLENHQHVVSIWTKDWKGH